MVAQARVNVHELMGRKIKLNFFSMFFVRNNQEIHLSFKNSEKQQAQALISGKANVAYVNGAGGSGAL